MNQDTMQGKWKEIKGEIRKVWGNITGDELEQTKGDLTSISGIIQQRYGQRKEDVSDKLSSIVSSFEDKFENRKADLTHSAAQSAESIKDDLRRNT